MNRFTRTLEPVAAPRRAPPARAWLALPLVAALSAVVPAAMAQTAWTTVASAGTVDEADTRIVNFINAEAQMRASAAAGSVLNLRYNVVALQGFSGVGQYIMRVRFRDNGSDARVQLSLRRHNTTGTSTTLATFDSNDYAPQVGYQTQQRCIGVDWDFLAGGHYVEAALTKSGDAGQPGLVTVQLIPTNCTP